MPCCVGRVHLFPQVAVGPLASRRVSGFREVSQGRVPRRLRRWACGPPLTHLTPARGRSERAAERTVAHPGTGPLGELQPPVGKDAHSRLASTPGRLSDFRPGGAWCAFASRQHAGLVKRLAARGRVRGCLSPARRTGSAACGEWVVRDRRRLLASAPARHCASGSVGSGAADARAAHAPSPTGPRAYRPAAHRNAGPVAWWWGRHSAARVRGWLVMGKQSKTSPSAARAHGSIRGGDAAGAAGLGPGRWVMDRYFQN